MSYLIRGGVFTPSTRAAAASFSKRGYADFSKEVQVPHFPNNGPGKGSWNRELNNIYPGYTQSDGRPSLGIPTKAGHFAADVLLRRHLNEAFRELANRDIALTEGGLAPLIPRVEELHRICALKAHLDVLKADLARAVEARKSEDRLHADAIERLEKRIQALEGPANKLSKLQNSFLHYLDDCLKRVHALDPMLNDYEARISKLEKPPS